MTTNKKFSLLYKKQIFYSIAFILVALGAYIAKMIQEQYKIVATGLVGFAVFYLVWTTYIHPKTMTGKYIELEDLEFPKDLYYLLYGFFWTMIMFWAGTQIIDSIRYMLNFFAGK